MKSKNNVFVVFLTIMVSLFILGFGDAQAGWVMYDKFNSGALDPNKWFIVGNQDAGDIYVDSGKLIFVLNSGYAGTYLGIQLIDNPEQIQGIKFKINVISMENDARWKIDAGIGYDSDSEKTINSQFGIKAGEYKFYYSVYYEGPVSDPISEHTIYSDSIIGNTYTLVNIFGDLQAIKYRIKEVFSNTLKLKNEAYTMLPHPMKNIGMKSSSGVGSCIIEIDNVRVLLPDSE